jgi:ferric-dicitrate binding protein FerR (iron transport regulator)
VNTQEYLKYLLDTEEWTAEEKKWMLQYLEANDLSELESVAASAFNTDIHAVKNILDRRLSENMLSKIHQQIQVPPVFRAPVVRWYQSKIAVAVLLVLITGTGYYFKDAIGGFLNPVEMLQVTAGKNERKMVQLPDGSSVNLEPGSTLGYPREFKGKERAINLDGEAFFEVTRNAEHPFVIRTRLIHTTVLGTSFSVQAYGAQEAKVVVVTGRVKVQTTEQGVEPGEVEVTVNQAAVYNRATGQLEKRDAADDARFYAQRHSGKFIYSEIAVATVIKDMERFYNTPIVLKGDVKDCLFNGSVYTSDDLEKALRLVTETLNAKLKKDSSANSYIITGGACH